MIVTGAPRSFLPVVEPPLSRLRSRNLEVCSVLRARPGRLPGPLQGVRSACFLKMQGPPQQANVQALRGSDDAVENVAVATVAASSRLFSIIAFRLPHRSHWLVRAAHGRSLQVAVDLGLTFPLESGVQRWLIASNDLPDVPS